MDEEMEDFVVDFSESSEVDFDYEFDAARFFDFVRPESSSEAEEADRWFESAGSYPPSPFIMKLKWREDLIMASANASLKSNDGQSMISRSNNLDCDTDGPKSHNYTDQDIMMTKTKFMDKSSRMRSSTLMKPTASHLAKLNRAREVHSSRHLGRSQKPLTKIDESRSRNFFGVDSNATKRQKLENGYLRKVAHLKHQSLLLHKLTKVGQVDANTMTSRSKVTIPRDPYLETGNRAQRPRSRNSSESGEHAKLKAHNFKACPSNQKVLRAPSKPLQKKSRPQSPVFQPLNMQNSELILTNETPNTARHNCEEARKQQKSETVRRAKASPFCNKDWKPPNDNTLPYNPPIELFNKLSLKSELEHNAGPLTKPPLHVKGSKENVPGSFKQDLRRYGSKKSQCGSEWRIPEIEPRLNRSMDIR